jgi:hypothetical protein
VASGIGGAGVNVAIIPVVGVTAFAEGLFVGIIGSMEVVNAGGMVWDDGADGGSGGLIVGRRVVSGVNWEAGLIMEVAETGGCVFGRSLLTISDACFETSGKGGFKTPLAERVRATAVGRYSIGKGVEMLGSSRLEHETSGAAIEMIVKRANVKNKCFLRNAEFFNNLI